VCVFFFKLSNQAEPYRLNIEQIFEDFLEGKEPGTNFFLFLRDYVQTISLRHQLNPSCKNRKKAELEK
jgi:hypothetical protein